MIPAKTIILLIAFFATSNDAAAIEASTTVAIVPTDAPHPRPAKLTAEYMANPGGHKIGDPYTGPIEDLPPLPDWYVNNNSSREYADGPEPGDLVARELLYRRAASNYVGTRNVKCNEFTCYQWDDLYIYQWKTYYEPWRRAGGEVWCSGTENCQQGKITGWQTCKSWSVGLDVGIQKNIYSASLNAGFVYEDCKSGSDSTACTWNDRDCHCIWTRQPMVETEMLAFEQDWLKGATGKSYWVWGWAPGPWVDYGCGSKCSDK